MLEKAVQIGKKEGKNAQNVRFFVKLDLIIKFTF